MYEVYNKYVCVCEMISMRYLVEEGRSFAEGPLNG